MADTIATAEKMVADLDRLFYEAGAIGTPAGAAGDRLYVEHRDACLDFADAHPETVDVFAAAGLPV